MNSHIQVLLIGGSHDGLRVAAERGRLTVTVEESLPPDFGKSINDDLFATAIKTDRYKIFPITGGFHIAVHDSLDYGAGLARLFNRYPKKRARRKRHYYHPLKIVKFPPSMSAPLSCTP